MKKAKKLIALIITLAAILALSSCSTAEKAAKDDVVLKIVGTVFPYCDFARNIAPEAEVTQLLPPGSECHSYEPTAADIASVQNCDVFLRTSGEGEEWVDTILSALDKSSVRIVTLSDSVALMQHDDGDWDEHIWTSPENAKLICAEIADALSTEDKAGEEIYKANAEVYIAELDELSMQLENIVGASAHNTLLFGDRFPFMYLARDYELDYLAAFPGCGEDTEPNARTLADIAKKAKEQKNAVILHIELSSTKIAETLAEETKADIMLLHSCHNVTQQEMDDGATYLSLMQANLEVLKVALG